MFKLAEAKTLVADAIRAGIFNDLGSGSNVDICVITKDKVDYIRPYDVANEKGKRSVQYFVFPFQSFNAGYYDLTGVGLLSNVHNCIVVVFQTRRLQLQEGNHRCVESEDQAPSVRCSARAHGGLVIALTSQHSHVISAVQFKSIGEFCFLFQQVTFYIEYCSSHSKLKALN